MLKQKRRFAPQALSRRERQILERKSAVARSWLKLGKPVYHAITRGVFGFADREGGGRRLVYDAPPITARLRSHPAVRDAAVVAFPDRRAGVGLYAFVEADAGTSEAALRQHLAGAAGAVKPPELIQVVAALPRRANGEVRIELLQLIATNQVELVPPLVADARERVAVDEIIAGRRFRQDRLA
jgi:hypothetical protein